MSRIFSLFILSIAFAGSALATVERCFVEGEYQEYPVEHPLCLFYTGTEHYRNGDYRNAGNKWEELLSLNPIPEEYRDLLIDANNNLGYLYFHGYGVNSDVEKGIAHWLEAVAAGHDESEYHLCYAYGDPEFVSYAPEKALRHCERAEEIYTGKPDHEEGDEEVLMIIKRYKTDLQAILRE